MATPNRGYYVVRPGIPPRVSDINAGFIEKVDADLHAALTGVAEATAAVAALTTRLDAVATDEGANSQLKKWPDEFRPFAVGVGCFAPGNIPQFLSVSKFRVTGNWVLTFTVGRALRFSYPPSGTRYGWVKSVVYTSQGTEVTTVGVVVPTTITDVGLSSIQHSMPQLTLDQVADNLIPPEKLVDPPALEADLTNAQAAFTVQIADLDTQADSLDVNLTAHTNLDTGVHGLAPGDVIETVTGAQTKIDDHDADAGAHATLLAGLQATDEKGQADGYCDLDSNGKIPGPWSTPPTTSRLPGIGLKAVYRGATTIANGDLSQESSPAFTAVDPAKSFIIVSTRGAATTPQSMFVTAAFSSGDTKLTFTRGADNGEIIAVWQVVEFY